MYGRGNNTCANQQHDDLTYTSDSVIDWGPRTNATVIDGPRLPWHKYVDDLWRKCNMIMQTSEVQETVSASRPRNREVAWAQIASRREGHTSHQVL